MNRLTYHKRAVMGLVAGLIVLVLISGRSSGVEARVEGQQAGLIPDDRALTAPPSDSPAPVAFLTGPAEGEPLDIALDYIHQNRAALGLAESDLADFVVKDSYESDHNGVTHIYLQQRLNGIEVYNAILNINVTARGQIINVNNHFVPELDSLISSDKVTITAVQAVEIAAGHVNLAVQQRLERLDGPTGPDQAVVFSDGGISLEEIPARLVYVQDETGNVRLAWATSIYQLDAQHAWQIKVDTATGEVIRQEDWVIHENWGLAAEAGHQHGPTLTTEETAGVPLDSLLGEVYNVYPLPLINPDDGGRTIETDPNDPTASPLGWHDTNDLSGAGGTTYNTLQGNNVHAYEDRDANNAPPATEPSGGTHPNLTFDFALDLTTEPVSYTDAATTNLFYWNNIIHDIFYHYGFDEAAGNFQEQNYGLGGLGGDSVNAEAQDGGGLNNANFYTPVDGSNPRMQMFEWDLTTPQRDGDLESVIVIHEYGHGISIRLTGGPSTNCLTGNEQGGEGWSDWFGMMLTMKEGDSGAEGRGVGTYALGEPLDGPGIRTWLYSTDMAVNPSTYDSIMTEAVPHGVGSVWANMLWEVSWVLIEAYGYDPDLYSGYGGNNLALQLVVDGLSLQGCSPTFIDARDAIILADQVDNGGANECLLWYAFAKRGLGYSASDGGTTSHTDGTEAFDLPQDCQGDVWIEDTPYFYFGLPDEGYEPDPNMTGLDMWFSRAIWNRNDQDSGTTHENPIFGQENYLYFNLFNNGPYDGPVPTAGVVELYYANASTGLDWDTDWTKFAEVPFASLTATDTRTLFAAWSPPAPGHYCLLARIVSSQDPENAPPPPPNNIDWYVRNNNNVAWRNVNVVELPAVGHPIPVDVIVRRLSPIFPLINLSIEAHPTELANPYLAHGKLFVRLPSGMFNRWVENGAQGQGFQILAPGLLRVTSPAGAVLKGIPMAYRQAASVELVFEATSTGGLDTYHFNVVQSAGGKTEGGVGYEVNMP